MSSFTAAAVVPTLPPVDELHDHDDDHDDHVNNNETTQSEAETIVQPEVSASQETTSPEHEPDADAGAGDAGANGVPPPPPGPPPGDRDQRVPPPPPAERPRRRWQFGHEQTMDEQDEEYRREYQELLHLQDLLRDATERLESTDERISTSSGNERTHYQEKRAELETLVENLTTEIEKVRCLKLELWVINGRRHHRGWVPWRMGDEISLRAGSTPRPLPCQHPDVVRRANQFAVWWSCTDCDRQICKQPWNSDRPSWSVGVVITIPHHQPVNVTNDEEKFIILDSGCRRSVAGTNWHFNMHHWLKNQGLKPVIRLVNESFEFGGGEVLTATRAFIYPVIINDHLIEVDIAEVTGNCPPLLSSSAMKTLGVIMDYEKQFLTIRACNSTNLPLKESSGGHPILVLPKIKEKDKEKLDAKFIKKPYAKTAPKKEPSTLEVSQVEEITVKKGARKMLIKNAKDTIAAYEEGIQERSNIPQPTWHVDKMKVKRRQYSIMEICTWSMLITTLAIAAGWTGWQPITIESGYDLTTTRGINMAKSDVDKANPDVIVFAWPCSPWSQMQNLNAKVPGHQTKIALQRQTHLRLLDFAEWCERRQSANGKLFLGENPLRSAAWQQVPVMKMSERCWEAKPDMCAFGLCAPDTGEPIKKSTRIVTNSKETARLLNQKCPGCESHRVIEGSVKHKGKNIALSEFCGGYTRDFVMTMLDGFMHDLKPLNYLAMVVDKRKLLDTVEEEAAERLLMRNPQKKGKTDHTTDEDNRKKKKRRQFADELRAASSAGPRPPRSMSTRSMASGSASGSGTKRKAEETPVREFEERDLTDRYMEDLFEDVPYIDPIDIDQNDNIDSDNNDYQETPQTRPAALRRPEYQSPPEETPYPQERRHDPREDETPVTATEATASQHEHYPEDQDDTPYMDMDVDDNVEDVPEEVPEDVADQVPVEEVGEQITPRPHDHEQEEVPTMLDEVAFHGADLAGGEGEIPLAIMRVTDPVIRREVRNAHYNLGHPSTATLLRIMRRSGASDAAQRYARWWKCPLCAQRQAPRALNPTTAPYRPNTFNSMIGCDVKAIYDADGTKFEALNIVDLATGFQILAVLDGPSSTECAEKLWLWWVLWAGPPKTIVCDLGTSFRTAFQMMVERYGASSRTAPIESPWQIGMVERHGGVIGEIIAMIVHSSNVVGKKEMILTSIAATAAKNRRPGLHGHSPRSAVFGMDDRLDGSVIDSLLDGEQLPMHSQAATDARYQRALQIRQDAMKAIVDLDHSQRYHRAIAMRPSLEGPHVFLPGAQVFYWQAQGAAGRFRGRRRRQFDRWRGPGTVIGREMRDGQEREGYWVSHAGHLRLIAPQHLRPAAREEQISEHDAIRRLNKIVDELSTRDQLVYENLIGQDDPDEIEVPAGDDHDDSAPRGHRSHASSSMLDPDREPEPSLTQEEIDIFGDDGRDDDIPMAGPPTSFGEWIAEEPVILPNVEEVNLLVLKPSFKSRKGRELNPKFFDAEEHEAFLEADAKQWQQHLDLGAVEVIPPEKTASIPKEKILPIASRFVRTNKSKDVKDKKLIAASRLVIPGHLQDTPSQEDGGDRTDAPTVPQLGLHLGLSIAASKKWPGSVFDVSAAFLRGDEMTEEVYFRPPREGLPGVPPGSLIKAKKGIFGLRVAPRNWFKKAKKTITYRGWKELGALPGVFVFMVNGILRGLLLLHVDDGFHFGEGPEYETSMEQLFEDFEIPPEKRKSGCFTFLGRTITQLDDMSFVVSQETYVNDIKPVFIPKTRRAEASSTLTAEEKSALMSLVGQLAWAARESLPHIAYDVSDLQQRFNMATIAELVRANSVLRTAKKLVQDQVTLKFVPLDLKNIVFVSVTDASFAGQPNGGSQLGYATLMAERSILDGSARANLLDWGSKKIHRVVKSTLAAEAAAMSFGFDRSIFARAVYAEINGGRSTAWQKMSKDIPLAIQLADHAGHLPGNDIALGLATDCKSLFDLCNRPTSTPTEKRITLDLLDVREHLDRDDNVLARWIPTTAMLVDALTKHLADLTVLNDFFSTNQYSLREDPVLEVKREKMRADRKIKKKKDTVTTSS